MNSIYHIAGISKQSFHQWLNRMLAIYEEQASLLPIIRQLREDHPRLSCRQFYFMIKPGTMGRDRFEAFCHSQGFKIEQKTRRYRTTDSRGVVYFPNLILALDELTRENQLWVSDITYYEITGTLYFLTFIIDIFHRKIIGFSAADNLRTESTTLPAIKMAIANSKLKNDPGTIFHSERGRAVLLQRVCVFDQTIRNPKQHGEIGMGEPLRRTDKRNIKK